jgi:transposase
MERLELKDKERLTAEIRSYFDGNEEAKFIHRLHGILLFANKADESCDSIGELFGHSPRTISNWIKQINATGNIECLRNKPNPGRPSRLSDIQKEELKAVLQAPPEEHGIPANIWDGKSLSAYIKERYAVNLAVRTCQILFHTLGFSLKRARPVVARADEEKKAESKKTSRENGQRGL